MKAMPFHLGHKYLIDTAIKNSQKVTVLIGTLPTEPIPGELRYKWVKDTYKNNKNVNVVWCSEILPQYPEEHKDFWDIWVDVVKRYCPNDIDVIFSSELYGETYAKYLGIKHEMVDLERKKYPVSGTLARSETNKYWDFLTDEAKPYFMKRVVIMGPESTGKSTLVQNLSKHYNCKFVEEYGRTYTNVTTTKNLTLKDFENISIDHKENVDQTIDKLVIVDTEAITTKIFGELYLGKCESVIIDEVIKNQKYDLYLLMDVDVPWVDDGTRDFPHLREWHINRLKVELECNGIDYIIISGHNYEERLNKAIEEVNKVYDNN